MKLAPIVLFVYNRPWLVHQTLEALEQNDLASKSILYIYADGAKENVALEQIQKIEQVREVIKEAWKFKEIHITERKRNWGLAKSIVSGVTEIVGKHNKVIVLEDDMITAKGFLKYMNEALDFYQSNEEIISIHGYTYPVDNLPEYYFLKGADCWGWATWKRGWDYFENNGFKLLNEIKERELEKEFNFNNTFNYFAMLKAASNNQVQSWAVKWYASAFLANKLTLYPGTSYVNNIGFDGNGTHCDTTDIYDTKELAVFSESYQWIPVEENKMVKAKIGAWFLHNAPAPSNVNLYTRIINKFKSKIKNLIS